jgi:hypothetical protein
MRWLIPLLALVLLTGCGASSEETAPTPSPVAEPTPTAEPTPSATPTAVPLSIDDAPHYLDVSSVLPGFRQVDPSGEGLSNADLGLGPDFSEVVLFLSDEPFQTVMLYMAVISGEINKAREKSLLQSGAVTDSFVEGFESTVGQGEMKDLQVREVPIGEFGMLATLVAEDVYGSRTPEEFLAFYQDKGNQAALVFVLNISSPDSAFTIDTTTIAEEISARIDAQ